MSRKTANPANVADVTKAAVTPTQGPTEVLTTARPDRVNPKGRAAQHLQDKGKQAPQEAHDDVQAEEPVLAMVDGGGSGPFAEATRDAAPTAQVQEGLMGVASSGAAAGVTGLGLTGNAAGLTSALGMAGTATAPGAFYSAHMPLMGLGVGVAAASIGRSSSTSATVVADAPRPATYMKITAIDKDTGKSDSDFITRDTTLTVRGTLTGEWRSGDKAQVSVDGVNWTDVTVRNGRWSFTDPRTLEDGQHTYHVRVIDPAGQLIERNRQKVTVDTQAPTASIERMGIDEDTGSSNSDWTTRDKSLNFSGTLTGVLNPGETVQISWDGVIWHDLSVQGNDWSIRRTLREGEYTVRVRIVDTAGNTTSVATQSLIIDTNADERNDLSVSFDTGDAIVLSVTGIDDDIDLNQVSVTVFDQHGQEAQATYDAGSGKWVVADGSHALSGALQGHIHVQDIAGNTANASGALLSYTENRRADSFIGSVQAHANEEVTAYQFWNPTTQRRSDTSPDGFFRIDSEGRIFLTALGAASYANDADDTQTGGPLNRHNYWVQANAQGTLSDYIQVTLNERNGLCDDSILMYLLDVNSSGDFNRTLKDGRILSVIQNEDYQYVTTDLDAVDSDKQIIRMSSTGGVDPEGNKVELLFDFLDPKNLAEPADFLDDATCINLQASNNAILKIRSLQDLSSTSTNNEKMDYFLPSLEKVFISTQMMDSPRYAYSYALLNNFGSYAWMPKLKDITILAGGDSARLNIYNNFDSGMIPFDALRGDNFMALLETINLESYGSVALNISNQLGDAFMKSLTSISALGGDWGHTTIDFDNTAGSALRIDGDDGFTDGYMTALEVVTAKHQSGNTKIEFDNSTSTSNGADNYMSSLSLIDIYSQSEEALYFRNGGGVNYMESLEEVDMINSTREAYFSAINTSRMDEATATLRAADNFMTALKDIHIESLGRINFEIKNEKGMYYMNEDDLTEYYSPAGINFMSSLKNISLDTGANNGRINFKMSVDVVENPSSLASMQSLMIKGGEINAVFNASLESKSWLNFDNIQGVGDGQVDTHYFGGDWTNVLTVLGGFDTLNVNDIIRFNVSQWSGHEIDSRDDLVITTEGENVRIRFDESLNYDGSIVLLDVAQSFDPLTNIDFSFF